MMIDALQSTLTTSDPSFEFEAPQPSDNNANGADDNNNNPDVDVEPDLEPESVFASALSLLYDYQPITLSDAGATFRYAYPPTGKSPNSPKPPDPDATATATERPNVNPNDDDDDSTLKNFFTLTLRTPETAARNWALHASSVWAAAVFLADRVGVLGLQGLLKTKAKAKAASADGELGETLEVLELGAGAGLPGLVVAKVLAGLSKGRPEGVDGAASEETRWRVTLSDYPDEALVRTLRENVRANFPEEEGGTDDDADDADERGCGRVRVVPYDWGTPVSALLSRPPTNPIPSPVAAETAHEHQDPDKKRGFDLILAADTLWNASLHARFLASLRALLRRSRYARAHLVAGLHTGRGTVRAFLDLVEVGKNEGRGGGAALEIVSVEEWEVNGKGRRAWKDEKERGDEDDRERRRWVIWIVLGWGEEVLLT